jgi:hypothetical protein
MKIIDTITKLSIIAASVAIIITCSTAIWWMENDYALNNWRATNEANAIENKVLMQEYTEKYNARYAK